MPGVRKSTGRCGQDIGHSGEGRSPEVEKHVAIVSLDPGLANAAASRCLPLEDLSLLVLNTVALVIVTAVLGASLARREGLGVLKRFRQNISMGVMPAEELLDGLMILVAGILLITPGLITDATGFALLIPQIRSALKRHLKRRFSDWIKPGGGHTNIRFRA